MRSAIGMCLVWCGCAIQNPPPAPPDAAPPAAAGTEPLTCAQQMTMVATTSNPPTQIGPLSLDVNGVDLCFHLDPGMFTRARFDVLSPLVNGSTSTVAARLEDISFVPILDGADQTSGAQTRMALDWMPPNTQPTDVAVWLRATVTTPVSTTIEVSYFDPLD